jgi:molybdate transport system substrate-binding protein
MRIPTLAFALVLLAGSAHAAEIRIISPGLIYNAALEELSADYKKQTGNTVVSIHGTMDKIIGQAKSDTPPADIVGLPTDLMNTLVLDGGIVPGTYTLLGRGELALAVKKGAPKPDISTVAKLAAALKSAGAVMINDPKGGTMQGILIDDLLKRAEFSGVHVVPSSKGEGAAALARGEGDMAVQLVQEILNKPEIELVGPLPAELGGHMDAVLAVSSRSAHPKEALAFIRFLSRPEARAAWTAKGMKPF